MNKQIDYRARGKRLATFQTAGAVLVTAVMTFPLYWMLATALKSGDEVLTLVPTFWPKKIQLSNFVTAWTSVRFPRYMFNTLFVTFWHMFFQFVIGTFAAYGFARGRFKGKNVLFLIVLSAMMIPDQVTFIPIYVLISKLNWVDTFAGLILPGVVSAYMIFMLRQNFLSVDQSYLDAARVDGLGIIGTILHVLIPMCKASVVTVMLISFINGWNNYFWPKILSKSDETRLISVALVKMKNMFDSVTSIDFYNAIMAGVTISVLPVVIIFALNQKYMMEGYSKNAMK